MVNKNIALAMVNIKFSEINTKLEIQIDKKNYC
jgi:glycine cleavage system aminomethyltransferase T